MEEPIIADAAPKAWRHVKMQTGVRLAGGEILGSVDAFKMQVDGDWLDRIQPDICTGGGITGARSVFRRALVANKLTCPHSLGGGVALVGSLHLWAAIGGTRFVEMDGNPNALREDVYLTGVQDGSVTPGDDPGLGVDTARLESFFAE